MRSATIGAYVYAVDGDRSSITLPDGRTIPSSPHPTPEYEARSRELGYPDGAAMSREHDAIHAALAAVFGVVSPALADVADGATTDRGFEEDLVKLVAVRLNDPESDDKPGSGFVRWLRELLRPGAQTLGPGRAASTIDGPHERPTQGANP